MKIYYDKDADLDALREKQIAVIGYGSQGFAQSNNLRESGCNVTVGLRADSPSRAKGRTVWSTSATRSSGRCRSRHRNDARAG